eukprot:CAMPEP_0113325166 /NCGR_PEP_ID=MMETSP0010_2-20120614/17557_1 /TAXON_ID=216773 ORGANISM="Corethron hystrix, Strain 308" /NCGR_SAMPLE_ID=MMETSP0010_2 /ASSEMBLY_ACC=CAM_ASM_000155 /LENGTH=370 /DNA_ID=CAMNT_0000184841 /DNA_START=158 /DNA_END=1267 /DNA_ORIENTATION=+ /assembly_acc=CAM_ASM_000155
MKEKTGRPYSVFAYDWRRSVDELSYDFEDFCRVRFPGRPVQVLAHSLGGLIAFAAMRRDPQKFQIGGTVVGVPFGTGLQYLQDLHRGYYTELERCRQFLPQTQMSFSSHACFFPLPQEQTQPHVQNLFVDVSDQEHVTFLPDQTAIGKPKLHIPRQTEVQGDPVSINFYDPNDWERLQLGVFDPTLQLDYDTKSQYKEHMRRSFNEGRNFRLTTLRPKDSTEELPPLTVCATEILRRTKVPNQANDISRRRKDRHADNAWEYDYVSGTSVPGDGRIDYDKAFPPLGVEYKEVRLTSAHSKQMCREDKDGDLETIWREVELQLQNYIERENNHMVSNSEKTELVTEEEVPTANIVLRKRKKRSIFLRVGSW